MLQEASRLKTRLDALAERAGNARKRGERLKKLDALTAALQVTKPVAASLDVSTLSAALTSTTPPQQRTQHAPVQTVRAAVEKVANQFATPRKRSSRKQVELALSLSERLLTDLNRRAAAQGLRTAIEACGRLIARIRPIPAGSRPKGLSAVVAALGKITAARKPSLKPQALEAVRVARAEATVRPQREPNRRTGAATARVRKVISAVTHIQTLRGSELASTAVSDRLDQLETSRRRLRSAEAKHLARRSELEEWSSKFAERSRRGPPPATVRAEKPLNPAAAPAPIVPSKPKTSSMEEPGKSGTASVQSQKSVAPVSATGSRPQEQRGLHPMLDEWFELSRKPAKKAEAETLADRIMLDETAKTAAAKLHEHWQRQLAEQAEPGRKRRIENNRRQAMIARSRGPQM